MTSAKITIQEELLDRQNTPIDLVNLLTVDYGRGTVMLIWTALRVNLINYNQLLVTVLSLPVKRSIVLALALRKGASANLILGSGNNQYHVFYLALTKIGDIGILQDYYQLMLMFGMNIKMPVAPRQPTIEAFMFSRNLRIASLQELAAHDPKRLSYLGLMANKPQYARAAPYSNSDIISNYLPSRSIDITKSKKMAWRSDTLEASLLYIYYEAFEVALKEGPIPYPCINDILIYMMVITSQNRYMFRVYYHMLDLINQRGTTLDTWQLKMLNSLANSSMPECRNIAGEFPIDFARMSVDLGPRDQKTLNNVCSYANKDLAGTATDNSGTCGEGSLSYIEDRKKYCFSSDQLAKILSTKQNPQTGKPIREDFLRRIRNTFGSKTSNEDVQINKFVFNSGVILTGKSPEQLDTIVNDVFKTGTGRLSKLEPGHAIVTAAWIGNWAKDNDPTSYNKYVQLLGQSGNLGVNEPPPRPSVPAPTTFPQMNNRGVVSS
jgi:hypothetical protein